MNPLVSIIVPIYGVEKYIAQCANSLFLQTYDNLEFIFVNDCTKDNSIVILQEVIPHYPNRVKHVHIIEHDHNQGLAASRNSGVEAAHGEWLMHVDSDDFIDPTTVAECVKKAYEDHADYVVFGMMQEFKNNSFPMMPAHVASKDEYLRLIVRKDIPSRVWGGLIKTSLYRDHNIHAIPGVNFAEDYSVTPKLYYFANKISFLYKPLYHYIRFNEGSYTAKFNPKVISNSFAAMDEIERFFNKVGKYQLECEIARLRFQAFAINAAISFSKDNKYIDQLIESVNYSKEAFNYLSVFHKIVITLAAQRKKMLLKLSIRCARCMYNILRPYLKRE